MLQKILFGFLSIFSFTFLSAQMVENQPLIRPKFQHAVNYSFATAHISQNHSLAYMPYWGAHSFRLGLRFHINNSSYFMNSPVIFPNNPYDYPPGDLTFQRGYAADFSQKIGYNFAYQYNFKLKKRPFLAPYLFYDTEIAYVGTRYKEKVSARDRQGTTRDIFVIDRLNEANWTNLHTIGLGLKWKMYKNFSLDFCVGIGVLLIKPIETVFINSFSERENWELVGIYDLPMTRIGISYALSNFNKKN